MTEGDGASREYVDLSLPGSDWEFNSTAPKFDEHVRKSVPFYDEGHDLIAQLSNFFLQDGDNVYDIGCSTGALLNKLSSLFEGRRDVRFFGVEVAPEMAAIAEARLANYPNTCVVQDDILNIDLAPSAMIVSYYTMQFIRPCNRQTLFDRVFKALHFGGAFLLFEKVRAPDARFQDYMAALYDDFKSRNGFSDAEILTKSRSLRGVMEPYSSEENRRYLERAGFKDAMTIFKYLSFEGILAIK